MMSTRYEINDQIYITDLLTYDDVPSLIKYLNNPIIYANTLAIPSPYTEKDGEDFINKIKFSSSNSLLNFNIRLNSNDELIGICNLHRSPENERRTIIGYWLGEPYWNHGFMSKVLSKVIEIGKNKWENLVRFEGHTFTWNKGSIRVLEKCGLTFEGTLRKYINKNGQDIDINYYSLILE